MPEGSPYSLSNVRSAIGHYLLGRGAGAIAGVLSAILMVRHMPVEAYAAYVALMGMAGIVSILTSLGLDRAITRYVPEGRLYKGHRVLGAFIWRLAVLRFVGVLVVASLLAMAWRPIVSLFDFMALEYIPWPYFVYLLATSLLEMFSTMLQALMHQKLLTMITVIQWGGRLVWLLVLTYQGGEVLSLEQVLWIVSLPEVVVATILGLALLRVLRDFGPPGHQEEKHEAIWPETREVVGLAGHSYAFNLLASLPQGYFMRTLVAATLPVETVAAYGFFSMLVDRLRMYLPIQLMYNLVEPILVARYLETRDDRTLSHHVRFMYKANLLIIMSVLVFVLIGGQALVGLLTGGKYVEHAWILSLLVFEMALGSHVLAMQIVINVLKYNGILSKSGVLALTAMLIFIGTVFAMNQPVLLLFGTLVYSVAMNSAALAFLSQKKVMYHPPIREAIKLLLMGAVLVFAIDLPTIRMDVATHQLTMILIGGSAGFLLCLLAVKFHYANDQEMGMLGKLIRSKGNV